MRKSRRSHGMKSIIVDFMFIKIVRARVLLRLRNQFDRATIQLPLLCFYLNIFHFGSRRLNGGVGYTCQQQEPWKYRSYFSFSYVLHNSAWNFSLPPSHASNREVHGTTRTTCPHSSGLEMSFTALTAILTAARKRGIATILRQTDDNGQTTCQINKTRIYTFGPHNISSTKN